MRRGVLTLLLVVLTGAVFALAAENGSALRVLQIDPQYPLPPGGVARAPAAHGIAAEVVRDQWLDDAGLTKAVSGWDALDRDVLILRARAIPAGKLAQHYPKLDKSALERLQVVLTDAR